MGAQKMGELQPCNNVKSLPRVKYTFFHSNQIENW